MRFGVQRHSLGFRQSLDGFDHGVCVGTVLADYRDGAFAVGVVDQLGFFVLGGSVDVIPDRHRSDHLTGVSVHDSHHFAAATEK